MSYLKTFYHKVLSYVIRENQIEIKKYHYIVIRKARLPNTKNTT